MPSTSVAAAYRAVRRQVVGDHEQTPRPALGLRHAGAQGAHALEPTGLAPVATACASRSLNVGPRRSQIVSAIR